VSSLEMSSSSGAVKDSPVRAAGGQPRRSNLTATGRP
jgi:hypothetical protein